MDSRPVKRARQACDSCRRKKTRCPGEQPICSFCARLKQSCKYSDDAGGFDRRQSKDPLNNSTWEERFKKLEEKVELMLQHMPSFNSSLAQEAGPQDVLPSPQDTISLATASEVSSSFNRPSPIISLRSAPVGLEPNSISIITLPSQLVSELVELYIQHCDCQPISLFDIDHLHHNFAIYGLEVSYSILAHAFPFSQNPHWQNSKREASTEFAQKARTLVREKIDKGDVSISTLQALCLLAFLDITGGNVQRGWFDIGTGMRLCQSARLSVDVGATLSLAKSQERYRCFWSFYMLECFCSQVSESMPRMPSRKPPFPPSLSLKLEYDTSPVSFEERGNSNEGEMHDIGILGYALQLLELWEGSVNYITSRVDSADVPWSPNSGHFTMTAKIMEWETYLCKNHRFAHARFLEQDTAGLRKNSHYWGPWLWVQFTYHATLCLLNHPFFLSERAKSLGALISVSFLETSSDLALLHAKHISRLIGTLEELDFEISDPFFGYCAAVAATTHLWYCYVPDHSTKVQARSRFIMCHKFLLGLAKKWHLSQQMADSLTLANTKASVWEHIAEVPFTPREVPQSDVSLMWSLLKYLSDDDSGCSRQSLFHPSLDPRTVLEKSLPDIQSQDTNNNISENNAQTPFVHDAIIATFGDDFNDQSLDYESDINGWWNTGTL